MLTLLDAILWGILWGSAIILLIPSTVLLVECFASLLPARRESKPIQRDDGQRGRVAVLVPAHDEASGIAATVDAIASQLRAGDRLLVIADNCTDATAAVAREAGADVTERHDVQQAGKGYALAHGVALLAENPPDVVVVVDADMELAAGSLDALALQVHRTGRAVQSVNLLDTPINPGPRDHVASLAFAVKNLVRPRGLLRLGLPCHLMGTGMALPWEAVRQANLATGNIVEDMQLGLDLAASGHAASLCEGARVSGRFPSRERAARTQHARWEQGHLQTLFTQVPRLLRAGILGRHPEALILALDLCVPPLSLLVMALLAGATLASSLSLAGVAAPVGPMFAANGMVLTAVLIGSVGAGRGRQTWRAIVAVPLYLAWKLPLYLGLLLQPHRRWQRTEREG
ncbi:MAG: glycosyltransferase [Phycisphaeraceae bacterium]